MSILKCLMCNSEASLSVCDEGGNDLSYCVAHYNINCTTNSHMNNEVITSEHALNYQVQHLQNIYLDALADLSMDMFDYQRQEENENRLKKVMTADKSKISNVKAAVETDNVHRNNNNSNTAFSSNSFGLNKNSLWRTDMSKIDKEKTLLEIEADEERDRILKVAESNGILCNGCGSARTVSRNRYAIASSKNETWGNKDHDSGLHTVECQDCGCISGAN